MKKLIGLMWVVVAVAGCATSIPDHVMQKRMHARSIDDIKQVEIVYHADDAYRITDKGGSFLTQQAGLLGLGGMVAALAADTASRLTVVEREISRSQEFTAAVGAGLKGQADWSTQFAEQLAEFLRESSRTVILTKVERPSENEILSAATVKDWQPPDGHAVVMIRTNLAYSAPEATSLYKPIISVEYVLKNEKQEILVESSEFVNEGARYYVTYAGLLDDHVNAGEQLRHGLMSLAPVVYQNLFDTGQPSKPNIN